MFIVSAASIESLLLVIVIVVAAVVIEVLRRGGMNLPLLGVREHGEHAGRILDGLRSQGYQVLHNVPLAGGWGSIDHLVVGPTGVYVIAEHSAHGIVRVRGRTITENGLSAHQHLAEADDRARIIRQTLHADPGCAEIPVQPILCYPYAEIDVPLFASNRVDDVAVVGPRGARRLIAQGRKRVDGNDAHRVLSLIASRHAGARAH